MLFTFNWNILNTILLPLNNMQNCVTNFVNNATFEISQVEKSNSVRSEDVKYCPHFRFINIEYIIHNLSLTINVKTMNSIVNKFFLF